MKAILIVIGMTMGIAWANAQSMALVNRQHAFVSQIPAGNYSGITYLGTDEYAVVDDHSSQEGFFVFRIELDSITGEVKAAENQGFRGGGGNYRDLEGITFLPWSQTVLMIGERDSRIVEYQLDGQPTIRERQLEKGSRDLGYESLTSNKCDSTIWTVTEGPLPKDGQGGMSADRVSSCLRLQVFDKNLHPLRQYAYQLDAPSTQRKAQHYAIGVSELLALDDGDLLVLEREFFVPHAKIGSFVHCKLYRITPSEAYAIEQDELLPENQKFLPKQLLCEWTTSLSLFRRNLANYEGMCLGPVLKDGSRVIVLISDSQNHYGGVLKDWFKTIVLR